MPIAAIAALANLVFSIGGEAIDLYKRLGVVIRKKDPVTADNWDEVLKIVQKPLHYEEPEQPKNP